MRKSLAALAVAAVSAGLLVVPSAAQAVDQTTLRVGDCLDYDYEQATATFLRAAVVPVPCDGPHTGEVFRVGTLPADADTKAERQDVARKRCDPITGYAAYGIDATGTRGGLRAPIPMLAQFNFITRDAAGDPAGYVCANSAYYQYRTRGKPTMRTITAPIADLLASDPTPLLVCYQSRRGPWILDSRRSVPCDGATRAKPWTLVRSVNLSTHFDDEYPGAAAIERYLDRKCGVTPRGTRAWSAVTSEWERGAILFGSCWRLAGS